MADLPLQKLLLGRKMNVNYRTAIARQKRKVGIEYNCYSSMIPAPYSADLRWPVLWFVHIFHNSVGKASFFIDICERTLERYISKFLVIGHVKPGPVSRSYGSISFTPREELIVFAHQIWKTQFLSFV